MDLNRNLACSFNCTDVAETRFFPKIKHDSGVVKLIMISEAMPADTKDYFYAPGNPFYLSTTNEAFKDAGFYFSRADEYLGAGIYLTTALKCSKKDYLVSSATLKNCSSILEAEIDQFPNTRVIMMMGDFAIKSINYIWKRKFGAKVIPAGATYKLRSGSYEYGGIRFFPSYTQTGESFDIEKTKRRMIAEDIKKAMRFICE